ncbi:MAG: hypothetical protein JNM80_13395 [Phycisphaerae bacterium]|nr:hypothetical protein [Phycisphaerae bacterium]
MTRHVWTVIGLSLAAAIVVSVWYAAFIQVSPAHSVGIAAGALVLVERPRPGAAPPVAAPPVPVGAGAAPVPLRKPPPTQRKVVDWYRHGYSFQWAVERRESRLYVPPMVTLEVPLTWVWLAGFATPWGIGVWRRTRRRRLGLCVGCGYELAGASGCAECGRAAG